MIGKFAYSCAFLAWGLMLFKIFFKNFLKPYTYKYCTILIEFVIKICYNLQALIYASL